MIIFNCMYWGCDNLDHLTFVSMIKTYGYQFKKTMGDLAPGSTHARPSARPPIDMSGNFPAHVSPVAESPSNISPNTSEVISEVSGPQEIFLKYPPLSAQIQLSAGGRVGLHFFGRCGILIFFLLRASCQVSEHQDNF